MVFFNDGVFPNLGQRTIIKWYEVLQQQEIAVEDFSGGLRVSGGNLNMDK